MSVKRALVTGGAGFVGSHVAEGLIAEGCEVLAVDDLSVGRENHVPRKAEFVRLDITNQQALIRAFSDFRPDLVCHLAAQAAVPVSVRQPVQDLRINVEGTLNVCRAADEARARIIYASTGGALYGDRAPVPTPESFFPEPHSPYGASKLAGELYVTTWGRLRGLPNIALRLGNVYGPRQNPHGEAGVVAMLSARLLGGERPTVFGDGTQTRDYIHVSDVVRAFISAVDSSAPGVFNVGWGRGTSVLELLEVLQQSAGTSLAPRFEPFRPGELKRSVVDPTSIAKVLGWHARIELREGIDQTFGWYADSGSER